MAGSHSASVAQEFSELSWWVAHAQNCGVGGEEWASHTVGVAPACQGHTALPFPVLRALLTPALRRRLLQAGPPSPPGAAFRVLLVLSPTHQVSGCGGFQTLASSLCAPRRTGPLSAGISEALSRGLLSHQYHCAPLPRHRPGSFKVLALCSQRLEPLQGGRNAEAVNP